jgi:hypothetical protein
LTTATPHRDSPYFGLNYYKERDGAWFFGRDNDTDRVVTNLLASRLTLLHADTGVGKSSLLRAGVARRLRVAAHKAQERGAPVYLPVVFNSWTDNPVNKLIGEITAAAGELGIDGRREGVKHLADAVDAIVGDSNLTLLLILDQFEEYFLYAATEQPEPGHFADELARCVNRSSVPASFLISIREEAYAGLGDLLKGRIANVYGNYLQIDHLDRASAEKAIREPLNVFNAQGNGQITIEDALVDAVLEQARTPLDGAITGDGRGGVGERRDERFRVATPLMELVLETVWEKERAEGSSRLRLKTLKELERGGLTIVDTYVKEALDDLDPRQRPLAIEVLDHMVTPDGAKVAASIAQLAYRVSTPEKDVRRILESLTKRPVVRRVPPPPGQDPIKYQRYEIFHDVLAPAINREITVENERQAIERTQKEEETERRLHRFRSRAKRFRLAALGSSALLLIALLLLVFALGQRSSAIRNLHIAQSLQLASYAQQTLAKDPKLSTLLALDALSVHETPQAEAALQAGVGALGPVFEGDTGAVSTASFSPDGALILTASADGSVRLLSLAAGRPVLVTRMGPSAVTSAVFSPDGRLIVSSSADGTATVRTLGSGALLTLGFHGPQLNDAEFSPDGSEVVTAGANGTARIWNTATGKEIGPPLTAGGQAFNSARFSPSGQFIVTAGADGTARIWDTATHLQIGSPLVGGGGAINSAAFSNSGNTIVTAGSDGTAREWSVATHEELGAPLISTGTTYSASYSPNDRLIVTTAADNTARIWNARTGRQLAVLRGSFGDAMFNPRGRLIVTAGLDQKTRVTGATVPVLIGPLPALERVARKLVGDRTLTPDERSTYLAGIGG